jgi:hypothetical protein
MLVRRLETDRALKEHDRSYQRLGYLPGMIPGIEYLIGRPEGGVTLSLLIGNVEVRLVIGRTGGIVGDQLPGLKREDEIRGSFGLPPATRRPDHRGLQNVFCTSINGKC